LIAVVDVHVAAAQVKWSDLGAFGAEAPQHAHRVARPIVWFLTATSNLLLRPFSDRTNFAEARISKEELEQMVDEAAKTGAIHEHASELATRALDFDRLLLRDVMLPRARIDALPIGAPTDQIRRFLLEE
jgi:putative hemolysin